MWRGILAILLLLSFQLTVSGKEQRSSQEAALGYRQDPRFQKQVTLPGRWLTAQEVINGVSKAAALPFSETTRPGMPPATPSCLVLQPGLEGQRLFAMAEEMRVSEVMEALEVIMGRRWQQVDESWVLIDAPDLARFAILPQSELIKKMPLEMMSMHRLSPGQVRLLESRGTLFMSDLTLEQQKAVTAQARWAYIYFGGLVAPEVLQLEGVYLRQDPRKNEPMAALADLKVMLPGSNGEEFETLSIPAEYLKIDPRLRVLATPLRNRARPQIPQSAGGYPDEQQLDQDPRLDAPANLVSKGHMRILEAVEALSKVTSVNLWVSTRLLARRFDASAGKSVRSVMQSIAAAAGGKWCRIGKSYALQPDPLLERLADLSSPGRAQQLTMILSQIRDGLTRSQRSQLLKNGELSEKQLSSTQVKQLRLAAALCFVDSSEVANPALRLQGVTLKLNAVKEDDAGGVLELILPSNYTSPHAFGSVPLAP